MLLNAFCNSFLKFRSLFARVHDSEDSLHRAEQLRASLEKNANDEIQDLRRQ